MFASMKLCVEDDPRVWDEAARFSRALSVLFKMHARIVSESQEDHSEKDCIFQAIRESIPMFDDDVISIIHACCTLGSDVFRIDQHDLLWSNICLHHDSYTSLWNTYERNNALPFDVFYFEKDGDIQVCLELCEGSKCTRRLEYMQATGLPLPSPSGCSRDRWIIGSTCASIPNESFNVDQHAELIGLVLEFNGLQHSLCHSIYIGRTVQVEFEWSFEDKSTIVTVFNDMYDCQAIWRLG